LSPKCSPTAANRDLPTPSAFGSARALRYLEAAFYMVGSIEEAIEKGKRLAAEAA
jgi:hypothetical protein